MSVFLKNCVSGIFCKQGECKKEPIVNSGRRFKQTEEVEYKLVVF